MVNKKRTLGIVLSIFLALGLSISIQPILAVWTSPTAVAPGNNTTIPLNTGSFNQSKIAGLIINAGTPASENGLIVQNGSMGVGTTSPKVMMDVAGEIRPGNTNIACTATIEGAIRYNISNKSMEYCVNNAWSRFVAVANCQAPWGTSVLHNSSVTAYQSASVPYGSSCISETRTCNNGTLSGSYANQSCTVAAAANCTSPWGTTVYNGNSITAYQSSSVPYGSSCQPQTRTCNNGTLTGNYTNQSCSVATPIIYGTGSCSPTPYCYNSWDFITMSGIGCGGTFRYEPSSPVAVTWCTATWGFTGAAKNPVTGAGWCKATLHAGGSWWCDGAWHYVGNAYAGGCYSGNMIIQARTPDNKNIAFTCEDNISCTSGTRYDNTPYPNTTYFECR